MTVAVDQLLAEHESWLTVERGLASNTVAAYGRDLRLYAQFLNERHRPAPEISEADVADFVRSLGEGDVRRAPSSVARAVAAVRSFHRFCALEGLLAVDPSTDLAPPRVPAGIPKALDEVSIERLLGAVAGESPRQLRDRAMLELLYATGMRISELVGMNLGDVDLDESDARVVGKGDKERIVPVGRAARAAVEAYMIRGRPPLSLRSSMRSEALFLNQRGSRLSRQGCWTVVKGAAATRRPRHESFAPRAPALVRDAHARPRGGHPGSAGDARSRKPLHDADLHEGLA